MIKWALPVGKAAVCLLTKYPLTPGTDLPFWLRPPRAHPSWLFSPSCAASELRALDHHSSCQRDTEHFFKCPFLSPDCAHGGGDVGENKHT
jgi:hypothetical protein